MRRDLRPFWVKRLYLRIRALWIWWFLAPRCEALGPHATIMSPWFVIISGPNIRIGHSFTAIGEMHHPVQIGVWGRNFGEGRVEIGDACLMSPGARISASDEIVLGNGCMMAHGSYITDSDWHGLYDRVNRDETAKPVRLGDNVWLGDRSTVLKGVTIGDNSIVAASSVSLRMCQRMSLSQAILLSSCVSSMSPLRGIRAKICFAIRLKPWRISAHSMKLFWQRIQLGDGC